MGELEAMRGFTARILIASVLLSCGGGAPNASQPAASAAPDAPVPSVTSSAQASLSSGPPGPGVEREPDPPIATTAATSLPVAPPDPTIQRAVQFQIGNPTLKPESDAILQPVKEFLDKHPEVTLLRIEAHTDNVGARDFNLELSRLRALSVARWFVVHGINCRRLLPVGFGDTRPITDEQFEGRQKSRRIEFHNASINGTPLGPLEGGGAVAGDPC
jgi:OOP family OmpA-OmpF porin